MFTQDIHRTSLTSLILRACSRAAPVMAGIVMLAAFAALNASSAFAIEDVWSDLKPDLFGKRVILDGKDRLALEAPYRAHDAALVPVTITIKSPLHHADHVKTLTLVIDQNPAPVAAVIKVGPDSGLGSLSTRLRVNSYSDIRVIAEMTDGRLYMVKRFVKASGGCSAPASKNADMARKHLGEMKLRQFTQKRPPANQSALREVQIMIRHMNNSGLQRDMLTGLYIPAHFVNSISIKQAGRPLLDIQSAISISENPTFRFSFLSRGAARLDLRATDTEGGIFKGAWDLIPAAKNGS